MRAPGHDPWEEEEQLSSEELLASASGALLPGEERLLHQRLRSGARNGRILGLVLTAAAALWIFLLSRGGTSPVLEAEQALLRGDAESALLCLGRSQLAWGAGAVRSQASASEAELRLRAPLGLVLDTRPSLRWEAPSAAAPCRLWLEDEQGGVLFSLSVAHSPCEYPSESPALQAGRPYALHLELEQSGESVSTIFYVARPEQEAAVRAELESIERMEHRPLIQHFLRAHCFGGFRMWSAAGEELHELGRHLDDPARMRLADSLALRNAELAEWLRVPYQDWRSE